jgi:small multidrug resistance family-3 protein
MAITRAVALFIPAGLAEIGGGYLVWRWLRDGAPVIVAPLLWGSGIDGKQPDRYDRAGAALVVAGTAVLFFAPRS